MKTHYVNTHCPFIIIWIQNFYMLKVHLWFYSDKDGWLYRMCSSVHFWCGIFDVILLKNVILNFITEGTIKLFTFNTATQLIEIFLLRRVDGNYRSIHLENNHLILGRKQTRCQNVFQNAYSKSLLLHLLATFE